METTTVGTTYFTSWNTEQNTTWMDLTSNFMISNYTSGAVTSAPEQSAHFNVETILKVIYAIIGVLGMLGNGLVVLVFLAYRKSFSSITNLFILNQSVMDFIVAVVFMLDRFGPTLYLAVESEALSVFFCRFWDNEYFLWALYIGTTQNLVLISVERYFATVRPIIHRNHFSVRKAKVGIVAVWLFGLIYQTYWVYVYVYVPDPEACYPDYPNAAVQISLGIFVFFMEFLIPLVIMTFSYCLIINMLATRGQSKTGKVFSRAKKNVTITTILVFVSFVICWTPTEIGYLLFNLGQPYDFEGVFHYMASTLVLVNMCTAPLIYTFNYEQFRNHLKQMLCSKCLHLNRVDLGSETQVVQSVQGTHETDVDPKNGSPRQ